MTVKLCTDSQVRESQLEPDPFEFFRDYSARELAVQSLDTTVKLAWWVVGCQKVRDLAGLLRYADIVPSRGKKREPMDIDEMVAKWVEVFAFVKESYGRDPSLG